MDGQNFGNEQNNSNHQYIPTPQYNNYQDNTGNMPYQNAPVPNYNGGNGSSKANGLQIGSLVLGIISIVLCCCYGVPSIILGIVGIICAVCGNRDNKNGVGIAGLICSIIGIGLGIFWVFIYALVIIDSGGLSGVINRYGYYY